jgi:hypothetical protein
MIEEDRLRLVALRFPPEVIDRAVEVLRVWGVERLFATCCHCWEPCIDPDLPRGQKMRVKLPAVLFHRHELRSCRNTEGKVACMPCDDLEFG